MSVKKIFGANIFALTMALSLVACAEDKVPDRPTMNPDLVPFFIGFTKDGKPVPVDEKGNIIQETPEVEFPVKATAIESFDSISMVQYRGSHYKLVKIGNKIYSIPLPH